MTEPEAAYLHAFVRGRIQGVGFRAFVQRRALQLGLQGFVRNLADGASVEVVAEGRREVLQTLLVSPRQGPPGAFVERIDTTWGESTAGYRRKPAIESDTETRTDRSRVADALAEPRELLLLLNTSSGAEPFGATWRAVTTFFASTKKPVRVPS
jgi:acylphosphatase